MEFNYESNKKKNPIKIILFIIVLLIFGLILCASMIFTNTKIQIKTNSFENLAIEYIQNKYNIKTTVYDIEDTLAVEMEETKNKEKIIRLEAEDGDLIDVLIIKDKDNNHSYADNFEESKIKKDVEEYFVQKFGEDINVFVNVGEKPMDGNNMIPQKYTNDTFSTINTDKQQDMYIFIQIANQDIDIKNLTMNDFPEIFPKNLKNNINRKIIIGKVDNRDELNIISPYDVGLYYDDEIETEIIINQYGVYLNEIRILSKQLDKYKKIELTKDGIFYLLTPDTIQSISYDENASIKDLPEYKEKFLNVKQLSGKYTFKLSGDTVSYVAIHKNDLNAVDSIDLLNIDAIIKEDNENIRAYGYPLGDYIVFSLMPYENTETDLYLIKVYSD